MRLFLVLILLLLSANKIYAQEYVLPYPSEMPGGRLYFFYQLKEKVDGFLYFGNLASFKYHQELADKYLVQAKTLFEYRQYLLAVNSLKKSNFNLVEEKNSLIRASKEGKDVSKKREELTSEIQKHILVLQKLKEEVPESFSWVPERGDPIDVKLWNEIEFAIKIRKAL